MLKKIILLISVVFLLNVSATETEVKEFIEQLTKEAISIISTPAMETENKEEKLKSLFVKYVDTDWMSKFVLGRHYRDLEPTKQDQFKTTYREYLMSSYIPKFKKYTGGDAIKIKEIKEKNNNMYLVKTIIDRVENQDFEVNYLIVKKAEGYKIIDIIGEGVSLINSNRSEFSSVISNRSFNNLIEMLNRKK